MAMGSVDNVILIFYIFFKGVDIKKVLSRYDLVFNDEVGAIKNSAFNTDSAHQAYGLEGCVTGTLPAKDFNLFNIKSTKHTFVALRVR